MPDIDALKQMASGHSLPHTSADVVVLSFLSLLYSRLIAVGHPPPQVPEIDALKADVEAFSKQFPTIGFEKSTMRYQD